MNITDHDRHELKSALAAIGAQHQGVLNPRDIVEAARNPDHVLHSRFEWDDAIAGEAYRLEQASSLIRRLRLTVIKPATGNREVTVSTTRAYQSRPSMRSREGGYEAIEVLLADVDKRRELLSQVLVELVAYRKRYAELSELETVWIAVDEAVTDYRTDEISPSTPTGEDARHDVAG